MTKINPWKAIEFVADIFEDAGEGKEFHAKSGRLGKFKVFDYKRKLEGRFYQQKRIEVIYVCEGNTLITITAYSFFGKWE